MQTALIGYSGFVGKNLQKQFNFTDFYNSNNINDLTSKSYDLIVCSGIPASMWLANNFPEKDLENIKNLLDVLKTVNVEKFVLISSTAVFKQPVKDIYEDSQNFESDLAYGKNRRYAEIFIEENFKNHLIIRLPALFGFELKKNFIYDLLNQEPSFISNDKYNEILNSLDKENKNLLNNYYIFDSGKNIFSYNKENAQKDNKRKDVLDALKQADFTALKFTNAESVFQFYNLENLWKDINIGLKHNIKVLNICSEPIMAKTAAKELFGFDFVNDNGNVPFDYDMKTHYASLWGKDGLDYQYTATEVIDDLKKFVNQ